MSSAEHNTFNSYLPPFIDNSKKLIIFSMVHYYIADDGTREGYYKTLSNAISDENADTRYSKMMKILKDMSPYIIKSKIQTSRKQTRVIDSVTRNNI